MRVAHVGLAAGGGFEGGGHSWALFSGATSGEDSEGRGHMSSSWSSWMQGMQ